MASALVYLANFMRNDRWYEYVGASEIRKGASERQTIFARRAFHLNPPKGCSKIAWLQGLDEDSLKLEHISGPLRLSDALIEEAREAAKRMMVAGQGSFVRGGPWCRCRLPGEDWAEVEAVAACTNRAQVKALVKLRDFRTGSLAQCAS